MEKDFIDEFIKMCIRDRYYALHTCMEEWQGIGLRLRKHIKGKVIFSSFNRIKETWKTVHFQEKLKVSGLSLYLKVIVSDGFQNRWIQCIRERWYYGDNPECGDKWAGVWNTATGNICVVKSNTWWHTIRNRRWILCLLYTSN